jgi:bacterioferritin-associated ferredoxin
MYVCLCHNVTEHQIRQLVRCEGVTTVRELGEQLGVATQCGKCAGCARNVLRETRREMRAETCCPELIAA